MDIEHNLCGLRLAFVKVAFKDSHHKLHGRVIIVVEHNPVHFWFVDLILNIGEGNSLCVSLGGCCDGKRRVVIDRAIHRAICQVVCQAI